MSGCASASDTGGAATGHLGQHQLVGGAVAPLHPRVRGDLEVVLDAHLRHALHVAQPGLEQLAEAVGLGPELLAEQGPHHDPAHRVAQRRTGVEPGAGLPGGEGAVDLVHDQPEVGIDPLDREGRLHEPAPPAVVLPVGHHQRGRPVDSDERLHGLAPLERVGRRGDHVLVGLGAGHEDRPAGAVPEVGHRPVAPAHLLHHADEVSGGEPWEQPGVVEHREPDGRRHPACLARAAPPPEAPSARRGRTTESPDDPHLPAGPPHHLDRRLAGRQLRAARAQPPLRQGADGRRAGLDPPHQLAGPALLRRRRGPRRRHRRAARARRRLVVELRVHLGGHQRRHHRGRTGRRGARPARRPASSRRSSPATPRKPRP